jgi:hypothetical protein
MCDGAIVRRVVSVRMRACAEVRSRKHTGVFLCPRLERSSSGTHPHDAYFRDRVRVSVRMHMRVHMRVQSDVC